MLKPKEKQAEKNIKENFEHEVGEKTISAAQFNLYFNLAKLLSPESKVLSIKVQHSAKCWGISDNRCDEAYCSRNKEKVQRLRFPCPKVPDCMH